MRHSWRDVAASEHLLLLRFLWVQKRMVFLTPKYVKLRKRDRDKNVFGQELDAALHQMAGQRAHVEQCMIESLVRTEVSLFKVQLASIVVGFLVATKGITVGVFGDW